MTGYVYRIDRAQRRDGPGLRTTVHLKGCPLRCAWCDRPETWATEPELVYRPDSCLRCLACIDECGAHALSHRDGDPVVDVHACRWCGDCADDCPTDARTQVGSVMTDARILDAIAEDTLARRDTGGGVTFSGGEPLMQPDFLTRLLAGCHARGLHTAVDTCGHAPRAVVEQVARSTDLFLYDLKHLDDDDHRSVTGMSNRLVLENLAWLASHGVPTTVRVPLVPGFNDDAGHLRRLGDFVAQMGLPRIDLLPYRARSDTHGQSRLQPEPPDPLPRRPRTSLADAARALGCGGATVTIIDLDDPDDAVRVTG